MSLSWLSLLISRRSLAPGFLDEPDASEFRLIGKLSALKKGAGTNSAEQPLGHLAIGSCPLFIKPEQAA